MDEPSDHAPFHSCARLLRVRVRVRVRVSVSVSVSVRVRVRVSVRFSVRATLSPHPKPNPNPTLDEQVSNGVASGSNGARHVAHGPGGGGG